MNKYLVDNLKNIQAYDWGFDTLDESYLRLNFNESCFDVYQDNLNFYPDPNTLEIKEALSDMFNLDKEYFFIGNGSDDVLSHCFLSFFDDTKIVNFPNITYSVYKVLASIYKLKINEIKVGDNLSINYQDYLNLNNPIVLANPNAITGLALAKEEIIEIIESNTNNIVIIDEAYVDFECESLAALTKKYDNLIVVQTFSKSKSLAGIRLGYAIANTSLIKCLYLVRDCINPFNVDTIALKYGVQAIKDFDIHKKNNQIIIENKNVLINDLTKLGFEVLKSKTNFILVKNDKLDLKSIHEYLNNNKILIRYFSFKEYGDFFRITIGTKEQNEILIRYLGEVIKSD